MDGIEANHGIHRMAGGKRNTPAAYALDQHHTQGEQSGTGSKKWVPELSKDTQFRIKIGTAIGIGLAIWALAVWILGMTKALEENTKAVKSLSSSVWTIQDSVDYAYKFSRMNPTAIAPDPKEIVRERIK